MGLKLQSKLFRFKTQTTLLGDVNTENPINETLPVLR